MNERLPVPQTILVTRLRWALALLVLIGSIGMAGYMLIEGWTPLEALYMTVITLSTVGYREVRELSPAGQVFTMAVIMFGVGGMFYTATAVVAYFVEVQFPGLVGRRRMIERIAHLRNHYVICGFGRVGRHIAQQLAREQADFVVVDNLGEAASQCGSCGYLYVLGDATQDETLKAAGIERARGMVTALDTDEENLYVVLSARVLRPDIFIVARATSATAESKLKRVGANRVLTPYELAGRRMATLLARPLVADFLDTVMHREGMELLLEELSVAGHSPLAGKTIGELHVRARTGAIILAVQKKDGGLISAPGGSTLMEPGDRLVILGTLAQLKKLEGLQAGA